MPTIDKVFLAELHKTRRIYGLTISVALPCLVIFLLGGRIFLNANELAQSGINHWAMVLKDIVDVFALLYPFYVVIIAFLLHNIEHKARGYNLLFIQPAKKFHFYASKYLILLIWLVNSIVVAVFCTFLLILLLQVSHSAFRFGEYQGASLIVFTFLKLFLSLLGILSIQFVLSLYFKNFIKSVGLGALFLVFGILLAYARAPAADFFPYSYPVNWQFDFYQGDTALYTRSLFMSLCYAVVFFGLGHFVAKKDSLL